MIELRPYQTEAIQAIARAEQAGRRRVLLQLPTGMGKTVVFGTLAAGTSRRSLIMAHRDELIEQAVAKLRLIDPDLDIGVVKAARHEVDHRIVVASVQTLAREKRRSDLGAFGFAVVDEAHHAIATTYRTILEDIGAFREGGGPFLLGVTATPVRGDQVGLSDVFEEIVYEYPLLRGIEERYLSNLRGIRVTLAGLNLDQVQVRQGDWQDGALGAALEDVHAPEHVAAAYRDHAAGRKAIVFTPTVALAEEMIAPFERVGAKAEVVHGKQPIEERRQVLERFRSGETQVVANCGVLTEGFDEPSVDCIIVARPTKSKLLYCQMIGRGTRRYVGKDDCLVIDMAGVSQRHTLMGLNTLFGLPPTACIKGESILDAVEEQRQAQTRRRMAAQGTLQAVEIDLFRARTVAKRELQWIRAGTSWALSSGRGQFILQPHADTWRLVEARPDQPSHLIETGDFQWLLGRAEDLARQRGVTALVAKDAPWRAKPASEKQIDALRRMRVRVQAGLTAGEASDLISQKIAQRRLGA